MSRKAFGNLKPRQQRVYINRVLQNVLIVAGNDVREDNIHVVGEPAGNDLLVGNDNANEIPPVPQVLDNPPPVEQRDGMRDAAINLMRMLNIRADNPDNIVLIGDPVYNEGPPYEERNIFDDRHRNNPQPEVEEQSEDEDFNINEGAEPLYHNAHITLGESMLIILTLMIRHNLPMVCVADIIIAILLHCPQQNLKRNNFNKFKKFCNFDHNNTTVKHYFCSICSRDLVNENDVCGACQGATTSYFVQLPLIKQIKEMYKRPDFFNLLQSKLYRPPQPPGTISDIYDGQLYKNWVHNGFLADANNISFCWYTDGIPVFKSSKVSFWPVYFTINELPFAERKLKKNTLLAAIWFGDKKPNMNQVLCKLVGDIRTLFDGIRVTLANGNNIRVRGVVLIGTCDLPAKSDCLNIKQFNGRYGCPVCVTPGRTLPVGPGRHLQVYPYVRELEERTSDATIEHANLARPREDVFGVKGHSALSILMSNHFIEGMGIDRMHAVDGGVMKKLLSLFFNSSHVRSPFSLSAHTETIDARLKTIKPPKFVHRMPRNVGDLVHWKASELKMFLFYYSLPVFEGIMNEEYFQHFLKLILASSILSSDTISDMHIEVAEDLLHCFVRDFEDLYGLQFSSINVHLLLHLPNCVRRLGPLWVYSCYEYEDLNGQFLRAIHGTWHLESQIVTSHSQLIKTARLIEALPAGPMRNFCLKKKRQVAIIERIHEHTYSVGAYRAINEVQEEVSIALRNSNINQNNFLIWIYYRLLKRNKLYVSEQYRRVLQTQSSVVQYDDDGIKYGIVLCFLRLFNNECCHDNCNCEYTHHAVIREVVCDNVFEAMGDRYRHDTRGYIYKCNLSNVLRLISVQSLVTPCVYMVIANQSYVAVPINSRELE